MNKIIFTNDIEKVKTACSLIRGKCQFNQKEFAENIGYNETVVSSMLNGKRELTEKFVKAVHDFGKDILPPDLLVEQTNVNQANVFGNNQQNDSEVILKLIQSYEKQLQAKDEQINKLIEKIH